MSIALHVDPQLKVKIIEGQYIDLARLIPKDRIIKEEEQKMQMVMKNGNTYFVPANENGNSITGLNRWDQAFRIYAEIYCTKHACRATELLQYSHVIHLAASAFVWENVYAYDKDFRLHMAENPGRSWAIILQQAWSMRLRDRLRNNDNFFHRNSGVSEINSSDRFPSLSITFNEQ